MSDTAKEILAILHKILPAFPDYVKEAKRCLQIAGSNQSRETNETLVFLNSTNNYINRFIADINNMLWYEQIHLYIDFKLIWDIAQLLKKLPQRFPDNIQPIMHSSISLLQALLEDMNTFFSLFKIRLLELNPALGSDLRISTKHFPFNLECSKPTPLAPSAPFFTSTLFPPPVVTQTLSQPLLPNNPKASPSPLSAEQKLKIEMLITTLQSEISIFCWYLNKERKRKKISALQEIISETNQGKGITETIERIDKNSRYSGIRSGIFSTRVNDLLNQLTPIKKDQQNIPSNLSKPRVSASR